MEMFTTAVLEIRFGPSKKDKEYKKASGIVLPLHDSEPLLDIMSISY